MKMGKGENDNQIAILQAILRNLKIDDAQFRSIIKEKQSGDASEILRRLRIQNKKLLEQVSVLKVQLKQEKADKDEQATRLNHLMKLNNLLSCALGSCKRCWGEDPACIECKGRGAPGWLKVDIRRFFNYVWPVIEKLSVTNKKVNKFLKDS